MSLPAAVAQHTTRTVRNGEVFRYGLVTAVVAGSPTLYEIDGERELPAVAIGATLTAGQLVVYYAGTDGFILGKLAGT